jgi:hypothetical protein
MARRILLTSTWVAMRSRMTEIFSVSARAGLDDEAVDGGGDFVDFLGGRGGGEREFFDDPGHGGLGLEFAGEDHAGQLLVGVVGGRSGRREQDVHAVARGDDEDAAFEVADGVLDAIAPTMTLSTTSWPARRH